MVKDEHVTALTTVLPRAPAARHVVAGSHNDRFIPLIVDVLDDVQAR